MAHVLVDPRKIKATPACGAWASDYCLFVVRANSEGLPFPTVMMLLPFVSFMYLSSP